MAINSSLRTKLIFGFLSVIVPLAAFLYYSNYYAMEVVRKQVAQSNLNLLSLHTRAMDKSLSDINSYLYKLATTDTYVKTLAIFPEQSEDYIFSRIMLMHKFDADHGLYNLVDSFFAYNADNDDLISYYESYDTNRGRERNALIRSLVNTSESGDRWRWVSTSTESGLIRIVRSSGMYVGAWIPESRFMEPVKNLNFGESGKFLLVSDEGRVLTSISANDFPDPLLNPGNEKNGQYGTINDKSAASYIYMVHPYTQSSIWMLLLIPEQDLLLNLPFFQRAIYSIPFIVLLLIFIFVIILQRVLIKPISSLLKGMRMIGQGNLRIRLPVPAQWEIAYLIKTFNHMASEIEGLTIGMYEEKLRVQKAEFKHLQSQIKPHFYLNTLNIIYSLAVLKDHATVQKLAIHLADYFRFTIRTDRQIVTLKEECTHIANYLEIQRLRFPDQLFYQVLLPKQLEDVEIPPLTIQPFVENTLIHGFQGEEAVLHISIEVRMDADTAEGEIFIAVFDDGEGFEEQKLRRLQTGEYFDRQGESVGIWNVYHRLRMHFGEEVAIRFANRQPQGAAVTLVIPNDCNNHQEKGMS
ncbi:cache domain-containing sensor histidine kinase [Paenibacillus sp. LPE1-1-1.1]|uniref:cache domain-containing sensor histidine kinase n=1 Tax=Paenibacillus sp. LPE1-1-1.1 TaxID=3135230 RepID=UPI003431A39B